MRIAVYTIAKNEEPFVQRWADSCADADYRFIVDTGSTDNTIGAANKAGVHIAVIRVDPWRFDHARNHALNALPKDIDMCIALDMDEVLQPGWREALETVPNGTTRPRYKYVWSWNNDGSEGLVYGGDKIHARHNYRWKHPVHEILQPVDILEQQHWVAGLEIHHYPDTSKSRGQYFDLLKLAVEEEPDDPRNQFYLGREYFYRGDHDNARRHLITTTLIQSWPPERAAAYRMLYRMSGREHDLYWALMADPHRRENLVLMAEHYYRLQDWETCRMWAKAATDITVKPLDYLCDPEAWGWLPWDLWAVSAWNTGRKDEAYRAGRMALELNPSDPRLVANMEWYSQR